MDFFLSKPTFLSLRCDLVYWYPVCVCSIHTSGAASVTQRSRMFPAVTLHTTAPVDGNVPNAASGLLGPAVTVLPWSGVLWAH